MEWLASLYSLNIASPVAETEYGYDAAGRLTSIAHAGSTFGETHSYTYDGADRLTSYANVSGGLDATYTYDPTDQLTGADYTGLPDESYTYDDNGNRQSAGSATYSVGSYNRLLSDGTYTYGYDNEGNLTYREETNSPGWRTYYTWDHRNRLVHISEFEGDHQVLVADYAYDAFNQLVSQISYEPFEGGETSTVFVYDQGQVVLQFDKRGSEDMEAEDLSHRYLWGPAVDQLFADEQVDWSDEDADGEVLWALTDHLGSVRDVVDSNGDLRIHRNFDAFGNIVNETHYNTSGAAVTAGQAGYVDAAFAFTGRYFDKAAGLTTSIAGTTPPPAAGSAKTQSDLKAAMRICISMWKTSRRVSPTRMACGAGLDGLGIGGSTCGLMLLTRPPRLLLRLPALRHRFLVEQPVKHWRLERGLPALRA